MACVGRGQVARRQSARAGGRGTRYRYRRASSGDRRSSAALRQAPGARKGNRRYRLRPGTESRRSANRLGEVPGDGGRRAQREQAAMVKMKQLLIAVKGPRCRKMAYRGRIAILTSPTGRERVKEGVDCAPL